MERGVIRRMVQAARREARESRRGDRGDPWAVERGARAPAGLLAAPAGGRFEEVGAFDLAGGRGGGRGRGRGRGDGFGPPAPPDTREVPVAAEGGFEDVGGRGRGMRERMRGWRQRHGSGRMRHGDVRAALLLALQAGPAHGYELGQRLEQASQGAWKPSPGSIYPTLQTLADQDLVSSEERDGKRIYALTKRGTAEIAARADRTDDAPWAGAYDGKHGELREAIHALQMAAKQIGMVGNADQVAKAQAVLVDARRKLYELLAAG